MATFEFDHVHLGSPDPEVTVQYYADMFGAEVLRFTLASGKPAIGISLGGQKILVATTSDDDEASIVGGRRDPALGIDHFALTTSDSRKAIDELRGKGAQFALDPVEVAPGAWMAKIRGPQDVIIEVLQRRPNP